MAALPLKTSEALYGFEVPNRYGLVIVSRAVLENALDTGDEESTGAAPPPSLEDLLDEALEDRAIRQPAYTVGLYRDKLLAALRQDGPALASLAVDERAKIELAIRDRTLAREAREEANVRGQFARRVTIFLTTVVSLLFVAGVVAVAVLGLWIPFVALWLVAFPALVVWWISVGLGWMPGAIRARGAEASMNLQKAERAIEQSEEDRETVVIETGIKPLLRTYINANRSESYRTTLTLVEQEGLAELEDPRYAIPTRAREQLDVFLDDMPGGSIGISGPRGVGKTTLIRSVCPTFAGGTSDEFGLVVAAPVEFEPRDFLLHLFAEACRVIVGSEGVAKLRRPDPIAPAVSGSYLSLLMPAALTLMSLAGIATILTAFISWSPLPRVAVGVSLILFAWMVGRASIRRSYSSNEKPFEVVKRSDETGLAPFVVNQAVERLQDIWYQQTFTTGWSGKLKAPIGEAGLEGSRELARQQMTLPDISSEFRRLLAAIAAKRRVVIGIDELDKIESSKAAYRFINEMKVLFGVENCFFLVSVSEDAMSAFERRGMPFRDVFDSSFDDVVNVGFLKVDESIDLLQRRVIGMPLPFIYFCHCAAGGLARDVIRVAREIVVGNPRQEEGEEGWPIDEACQATVATDVRAKIEASLVATRAMAPGRDVESLRSWLRRLREVPVTPEALLAVCESCSSEPPDHFRDDGAGGALSPRTLACELLTFLLYAATLLEFFRQGVGPEGYRLAYESGNLDRLARSRQALALHPRAAWGCLEEFRDGYTPPFPEDVTAGVATRE